MTFCTSLRHFIQIRPPSAATKIVLSIFKMADLRHLGLYGSNNGFIEKPMYDFPYSSSIDSIALNCLVFFRKSPFCIFGDRRTNCTDRQTDGQHQRTVTSSDLITYPLSNSLLVSELLFPAFFALVGNILLSKKQMNPVKTYHLYFWNSSPLTFKLLRYRI